MQNTSELIKQLDTLPAFAALKKGLEQNLNAENFYVANFMEDAEQGERDEDGKLHRFTVSEDEREEKAVDELLDDNSGYFEEFVHEDHVRNDVTEFIRAIIKESRKCQ